jgi:LmbE family N-acetylglucosaminyl deacetylase
VSPFQKFVSAHVKLFREGTKLPLGKSKRSSLRKIPASAPKVLIFSPHPDDECINGALALRLLREAKWDVINVGVTLGSNRTRQAARRRELEHACAALGFGLIVPRERGLERISPKIRAEKSARWRVAVQTIAMILASQKPRVIFLPHENDVHPTHVGVHWLILDALKVLPRDFNCHIVEAEFWGQMAEPNVLVEISKEDLADLIGALACHEGEVRRNAYHARLPAWMMDNVRRGAELVGARGGKAPDFAFATIYRLGKWRNGKILFGGKKFLSRREKAVTLFR